MKCPNCNVNLVMTDRSGVEIDYCPECRGVWLDRGELDKIIEKSASSMSAPANPQIPPQMNQPNMYGKPNDYYKYKRKKSFLEELFD